MHDLPVKHVDVAVIGGGPAGLAAAIEADKAGASVLVIERDRELGGILTQCIHNGFGLHFFGEELTGPEYAARFIDALPQSIEVMLGTMALEISPNREVTVVGALCGLMRICAKSIVLAMGCRERTRGALTIPGTRPAGIYTAGCAQRLVNLDGYMPGKRVVVLGSGDIGLIMARRMTWEGAKVEMVLELMPYSSGLNRNIVQCLEDQGIPLKLNHTVIDIHGNQRLTGVTVAQVDPKTRMPIPGTEEHVPCDTLLLSVGLLPENELTQEAGIEMDRVTSGAVVDERRQTSMPGVFACGNVLHVHDLVDNVSEESIVAGREAARYAKEGEAPSSNGIRRTLAGEGVRYVVPQRLSREAETVDLYFRVSDVYRGSRIVARQGDTVLKDVKKRILTPGEMEKLTVSAGPEGDISLTVM